MARPKKVRPPHRGKVSEAGLWSLSVGDRPFKVTVREDRNPGARILFDYSEHGRRMQPPTELPGVRDAEGQFDRERVNLAAQAAEDMSARLRLGRLREEVKPQTLTVAEAFAIYTDPVSGGVGPSASSRQQAKASTAAWKAHLQPHTLWNRVTPSDVDALARKLRAVGQLVTARQRVKWLRTCRNWLVKKKRIRGLEDPVEGFDFVALMEGYEPKQPRYSVEEAEKIVEAAFSVDPRFRLLIALMDDSVVRRAALVATMRSDLDRPLNMMPKPEEAPNGWVTYPPLKGQPAVLWFLTEFQRREIQMALTTHLSELEAIYQAQGKDYPLFPAARIYPTAKATREPVPPTRGGAYRPVSPALSDKWLREAEKVAGIEHMKGRLWHGFRRNSSDVVYDAAGLSVLTTAGGWLNQATPGRIYIGKAKSADRSKARQAMEAKRRKGE